MTSKSRIAVIATAFAALSFTQCSEHVPQVDLRVSEPEKKVDVLIDGKLFTSYTYPEMVKKPILWPVISPEGNAITRTYPLGKKEGEHTDHPHHVGIWFNYGDVNGIDFWGNSDAVAPERKPLCGTIYHTAVLKTVSGRGKATLKTSADWKSATGREIFKELTTFGFIARKQMRIIDRETELTAVADTILFNDTKEGAFGLRVVRELELPSEHADTMTDASGAKTIIPVLNDSLATGNYRSSEGIEGEGVWGTRARWIKLSGVVNGEKVSIIIIDHPDNAGYPTYWHARGYGLFAANPFGQNIFSEGREKLNYRMKKGDVLDMKYRVVIASGDLPDEEINNLADEFAREQ